MNRRQIFLHGNNDILRTSSALWICALFALMCLLGFSRITRADMGPKPNIRIDVENPPSGDYYIALLSRDGSGENGSDWAGKVMEKEYSSASEEEQYILDFLFAYRQDGYTYVLSSLGSNLRHSNERHSYMFYHTVPSDFKIILFSADGSIVISDAVVRSHFHSRCTLDAATGDLTEGPSSPSSYLFSAVGCLLLTLLIEMILMAIFGLSVKKNFLRFLVTNLITQVFLNVTMLLFDHMKITGMFFIFMWILMEILIIIIEAISYMDHLKDKKDVVRSGTNIAYAITANVISALAEIPVLVIASWIS